MVAFDPEIPNQVDEAVVDGAAMRYRRGLAYHEVEIDNHYTVLRHNPFD